MKKLLVLVLSIAMVISMAVSVTAQENLGLKEDDQVPVLAEESLATVLFYSEEDVLNMPQDIQDIMAEAKAELEAVCPDKFAVKYFCYVKVEGTVSVVFEPIPHEEIMFKQFIDGVWVDRTFTINGDKSITVEGVVEAPLAVIVKARHAGVVVPGVRPSAAAKGENLLPGTTEKYDVSVMHFSTEDVLKLSEDIQNLMAEAKAELKNACPDGFAVKYFYYAQVIGSEGPVSVVYAPIDHEEILFKQYIDGEWVELDVTVSEDGTITVDGIVEAPIAVFTK